MKQIKINEIRPMKFPEKTYLFLVCMKRKHVDDFFAKGTIRFGKPSEWETNGTLKGDDFEGVYASARDCEEYSKPFIKSLRKNVMEIRREGITFFKSADVISKRVYCMYGLNSNNMQMSEKRSQDHKYHLCGKIQSSYFQGLIPAGYHQEKVNQKDDDLVVLIIRPDLFVEKICKALRDLGLNQEEIMIAPIQYFDYRKGNFIIPTDNQELFYKNLMYEVQSEIRIVINTENNVIIEALNKENGIINIGPIDNSIATMSELYSNDMLVEIRGNKLLYSLANPTQEKASKEETITFLLQAISDELPESPMSIQRMEKNIAKYAEGIEKWFGLKYDPETHVVYSEDERYELAGRAGYKIIEHFDIYMQDLDIENAGDCVNKFHRFFPMFNMEYYFSDYYARMNMKTK